MLNIKISITSDQTSLGAKVKLKHLKLSLENENIECLIQNVINQSNKWLFEVK